MKRTEVRAPIRGEALEPAAGHAADFIKASVHEEQLLPADPAALLDQAPEDAQLFEFLGLVLKNINKCLIFNI